MTVRIRSRLAITLFLLSPIAVVAGLCLWIVVSLSAEPEMRAEARGQGARDTGGANALGEWLAGRDPDEIQRRNRLVRQGEAVRPADLQKVIEIGLLLSPGTDATSVEVAFTVGGDTVRTLDLEPVGGGGWGGVVDAREIPADARWRATVDGRVGPVRPLPLLTPGEAAQERPIVPLVLQDWDD